MTTVTMTDAQELSGKLQAALEERAQVVRYLQNLDAYVLRLEGALAFVQGKLEDGEEPIQTTTEAEAGPGVPETEAVQG